MIKELLASTPENHYSLTELANLAGLSMWHFLRQFKNT
jgi:AraC-like DNA-binding protein